MTHKLDNFQKIADKDLGTQAKLLLYVLNDLADDTGRAFASLDELSTRTSLSPVTVKKALKELSEAGHLDDTDATTRPVPVRGVSVYRLNP